MREALSPVTHIKEITAVVDASHDTRITAQRIATASENDPETWGRAPRSIAAASLYVAARVCGDRLTQQEIADAAGIARATIRDNYPTIEEHADGMGLIGDSVTEEIATQ